jgi:hypothetical protein
MQMSKLNDAETTSHDLGASMSGPRVSSKTRSLPTQLPLGRTRFLAEPRSARYHGSWFRAPMVW